ncbi:MAG: leucine-rich repeat domain-containing protein [Prevotella sp.]|nr:leucine-rich repeat domain-containing protein [Prevotella sp.]MBR6189745.1 leucine-rich repeat domain-containing protein [Prevotella sp.]
MTMKKVLSFFILMLLPMVTGAEEVEIDGIYYELVSKIKEATVKSNPNGKYTGNVVIPASVTYDGAEYSVTSIGGSAFYNCSDMTSVTIPNSVTNIGWDAFGGCRGLTSVYISDIAAWCNISFSNYSSNPLCYAQHLYIGEVEINDLLIPNSVTSIGDRAFYGCSGLTSVTIPNSVTSIGDGAFLNCI